MHRLIWIAIGALIGIGYLGWVGYASAQDVKATEVSRQTTVTYRFGAAIFQGGGGGSQVSMGFEWADQTTTTDPGQLACVNITTNAPEVPVLVTTKDSRPAEFKGYLYRQTGCQGPKGLSTVNRATATGTSAAADVFVLQLVEK